MLKASSRRLQDQQMFAGLYRYNEIFNESNATHTTRNFGRGPESEVVLITLGNR